MEMAKLVESEKEKTAPFSVFSNRMEGVREEEDSHSDLKHFLFNQKKFVYMIYSYNSGKPREFLHANELL